MLVLLLLSIVMGYSIVRIVLTCNWQGGVFHKPEMPYRDLENHHFLEPINPEDWIVCYKYQDVFYSPKFDELYEATQFFDMLYDMGFEHPAPATPNTR